MANTYSDCCETNSGAVAGLVIGLLVGLSMFPASPRLARLVSIEGVARD
jgi:hypothetical protein